VIIKEELMVEFNVGIICTQWRHYERHKGMVSAISEKHKE